MERSNEEIAKKESSSSNKSESANSFSLEKTQSVQAVAKEKEEIKTKKTTNTVPRNKKKTIIGIISAFLICAVVASIVLIVLFVIIPADIRKSGGGLKSGEPITESTDPDTIISQEVSEEVWTEAVKYFNGTEQAQSLIKIGDLSENAVRSITYKQLITVDGVPYTGLVNRIEGMKAVAENTINGTMVYAYECADSKGESALYLYEKKYDQWIRSKVDNSYAKDVLGLTQQVYNDFDWSFKNFKYNKKSNAYEGKMTTMGFTFDVAIKIVNNFPCYLKLVTTTGNSVMESVVFYYDANNTEVNLPDSKSLQFTVDETKGEATVTGYDNTDMFVTVPSTYKGYKVTGIGTSAFQKEESNLYDILLPRTLNAIGESAFKNCTGLESITIPDSVTSIGDYAFDGCSGLTCVYYTGDIASWCGITFASYSANPLEYAEKLYIDGRALSGDIVLPDTVTKIPNGTFKNANITSITIPDSVTSIGSYAFRYCSNLTNITIPDSVTSIGSYAFDGCSIKTAIIPANACSYINNNALETVVITSGERIGDSAFKNCTGLESITIPSSVTSIGSHAFYNCTGLTSAYYTGDIASWCEITFDSNPLSYAHNLYINNELVTEIVIPDTVTEIKADAFAGWNGTSIIIPDSVTSIGRNAFQNCANLPYNKYDNGYYLGNGTDPYFVLIDATNGVSIDIADTTKIIYSFAFEYCSELRSITIPDSVTSIGDYAFRYCSNLTNITIPDSVTSIGDYAFSFCSNLTNITIPDSVTSIGDYAFEHCINLQYNEYDNGYYLGNDTNPYLVFIATKDKNISSFDIASTAKIIYYSAFSGCTDLTSITLPNSLTSIGSHAFSGCTELTSITLPNSLTSIGSYAFSDCYGLTSIHYTGDIASWCRIIFNGYYSNPFELIIITGNLFQFYIDNKILSGDIVLPNTVTKIPYGTFMHSDITSVIIPDSITSISDYAFFDCIELTSVSIPNSVKSIGHCAFNNCFRLTDITIPNSVATIKYEAFRDCPGLTNITYQGTKEQWSAINNDGWDSSAGTYTVHCTDGDIAK